MPKRELSKYVECGHCSNISVMEVIGSIFMDETPEDNEYGPQPDQGTYYDVLKCPACHRENIVKYFWHDLLVSNEDIEYQILYPINKATPLRDYRACQKYFEGKLRKSKQLT